MKKVLLGLSGGVDSAVSALLLRERGYEVTGCYLDNGLPGAESAQKTAEELSLPLIVRDIREELEREVCAPFAEGYLRGETPSPCVLCNPAVKFAALSEEADRIGAEYIATGHYAISREGRIYRSPSPKDQSYMLCRLKKEQAARLLLPLGELQKPQVRAIAAENGLAAAEKPDSMEICFIPDRDYAAWIEARGITPPPGDFLFEGRIVGRHRGIHHYTVGQRRRLGIALGKPVYVASVDPVRNTVTLAAGEEVYTDSMRVRGFSWLVEPAAFPVRASAKIRHSRSDTPQASIYADGRVMFDAPVRAPTPGQAAAFYAGELLLGGAWIE